MADERDNRLIDAAMGLRAMSPELWDVFVAAVREYAAGATTDMLRVDATNLQKQQGVALGVNQLALVLRDAPKTYEARRARDARPTDQR